MSKRELFGTPIDSISQDITGRSPAYKIYIWNPNRCTVQDVVLDKAESPRYDITNWVTGASFNENIVFENNDDAVATNMAMTLVRDPDAEPIEITERTLLDSTPVRLYIGDTRLPEKDWVLLFTGVIRGNPSYVEYGRSEAQVKTLQVQCVDRAEKYLNKVVTARSYQRGEDIGRTSVETAIEFMRLDRREINIGFQDYSLGQIYSQLVDIEVLKGIQQMLFTVGKKPRFDSEGKLVAADTDLNKAPVRTYTGKDLIQTITRSSSSASINNSVRLLGLDKDVTRIVESKRRLAFGSCTTGFFDPNPEIDVYFSDDQGTEPGQQGRIALHDPTMGNDHVLQLRSSQIAGIEGVSEWLHGNFQTISPFLEGDGVTASGAKIQWQTPFMVFLWTFFVANWLAHEWMAYDMADTNPAFAIRAGTNGQMHLSIAIMIMMMIARIEWEIHGRPVANVYQQLSTTAQLASVLTEDIKEIQIQNDWLYDIDYMDTIAKELLRRELIKGWSYTITMLDDPIIETDDIIEMDSMKFYITSITRSLSRPFSGTMQVQAWRLA